MRLSYPFDPGSGQFGDDWAVSLLDVLFMLKKNIQDTDISLERTVIDIIGSGILYQSYTPTLITATGGFNVTIGSHHLYRGLAKRLVNSHTLAIPPSGTYYLWEYQNNTDDTPNYAITTTNVNPQDANDPEDAELLAIPLATIVTDGSGVTSVTETFDIVYPFSHFTGTPGSNYIPVEENFPTWDSTDRTDGSLDSFTLSDAPITGTPLEIQRQNFVMARGDTSQMTETGSPPTFTFLPGFKPLSGERVFVRYFKAP